jgi:hypothetical protein
MLRSAWRLTTVLTSCTVVNVVIPPQVGKARMSWQALKHNWAAVSMSAKLLVRCCHLVDALCRYMHLSIATWVLSSCTAAVAALQLWLQTPGSSQHSDMGADNKVKNRHDCCINVATVDDSACPILATVKVQVKVAAGQLENAFQLQAGIVASLVLIKQGTVLFKHCSVADHC